MNKPTICRSIKSISGTSFHGNTINATRAQLRNALGEPQFVDLDCTEKVQYEWVLEIAGHVFTVYDWKEYRSVEESEPIEWHIGGQSLIVTDYAARELSGLLEK